jgi:hypothetical protein
VADVAVSLRLLRAFDYIANTAQHADLRNELLERAQRVTAGGVGHLPKDELARLERRLAALEAVAAGTEK